MRNWRHRGWNAGKLSGIKSVVNLPPIILDWFAVRGWEPRRHQLEMLDAAREGRHALLVAATGAGKTLAGFLPTLADIIPPRAGEGDRTKGIGGGSLASVKLPDTPPPSVAAQLPPPRAGEGARTEGI
jgi:hypothetical protein